MSLFPVLWAQQQKENGASGISLGMDSRGGVWVAKCQLLERSKEYRNIMTIGKKTGQCGGGAAVQACSGSCFVKHNFLVHDWIMFFQVEEKRIWDVFLRIYLVTTYLLNFSQKSSHKYLILIVISASLFPRAWFIDKIPCTSLQTKQRRLRIWKRQSYWVLL